VAVNPEVSRVKVEKELERAASSAQRRGWQLQWDPNALFLRASITAPDNEVYIFEFHFDDYPEIPPLIDAIHPETGERNTAQCFPTGGSGYFHSSNRICAYWSRNAYTAGGPHAGNWVMGDWASKDPLRKELGLILTLLADFLEDTSYKGRKPS